MYAYKDLLELAGLTTRLYTLTSTLLNMPSGHSPILIEHGDAVSLTGVDVRIPRLVKDRANVPASSSEKALALTADRNEPPLVKDLTLTIRRGEHLLITGSNGVGKTSVARVLAGLWDPSASGAGGSEPMVRMPRDETEADVMLRQAHGDPHARPRPTLYIVPQRAYMPTGSLLEQIIYPCSYASFVQMTAPASGAGAAVTEGVFPAFLRRSSSMLTLSAAQASYAPSTEPSERAIAEIHDILQKVHLGYLVGREGGLHVRKEWRDVLSGGEKQRMAIARVLWWRPMFAVLDGGILLG